MNNPPLPPPPSGFVATNVPFNLPPPTSPFASSTSSFASSTPSFASSTPSFASSTPSFASSLSSIPTNSKNDALNRTFLQRAQQFGLKTDTSTPITTPMTASSNSFTPKFIPPPPPPPSDTQSQTIQPLQPRLPQIPSQVPQTAPKQAQTQTQAQVQAQVQIQTQTPSTSKTSHLATQPQIPPKVQQPQQAISQTQYQPQVKPQIKPHVQTQIQTQVPPVQIPIQPTPTPAPSKPQATNANVPKVHKRDHSPPPPPPPPSEDNAEADDDDDDDDDDDSPPPPPPVGKASIDSKIASQLAEAQIQAESYQQSLQANLKQEQHIQQTYAQQQQYAQEQQPYVNKQNYSVPSAFHRRDISVDPNTAVLEQALNAVGIAEINNSLGASVNNLQSNEDGGGGSSGDVKNGDVCGLCMKPMHLGDIVEVMDQKFHLECFVCFGCRKKLSGEIMTINDRYYHAACLVCKHCKASLINTDFHVSPIDEQLYCKLHARAPTGQAHCAGCNKLISGSDPAVNALDKLWHPKCFVCSQCQTQLVNQPCYVSDGEHFCEKCHKMLYGVRCQGCKELILSGQCLTVGEKKLRFHPDCFVCAKCKKSLRGQHFTAFKDNVYCKNDYEIVSGAKKI